jgi:hypothetical protein
VVVRTAAYQLRRRRLLDTRLRGYDKLVLVFFVMPGLVPGIHVFGCERREDVDGRDEPGHDDEAGDLWRGAGVLLATMKIVLD